LQALKDSLPDATFRKSVNENIPSMILSKQEQDDFFSNYTLLLYYTAMYEELLPKNATLIEFGQSPLDIIIKSRDELFANEDILSYYKKDNGRHLLAGGDVF
jgi:hypothetical protein